MGNGSSSASHEHVEVPFGVSCRPSSKPMANRAMRCPRWPAARCDSKHWTSVHASAHNIFDKEKWEKSSANGFSLRCKQRKPNNGTKKKTMKPSVSQCVLFETMLDSAISIHISINQCHNKTRQSGMLVSTGLYATISPWSNKSSFHFVESDIVWNSMWTLDDAVLHPLRWLHSWCTSPMIGSLCVLEIRSTINGSFRGVVSPSTKQRQCIQFGKLLVWWMTRQSKSRQEWMEKEYSIRFPLQSGSVCPLLIAHSIFITMAVIYPSPLT